MDEVAHPHLKLLTPKTGGHLGFISRRKPRFWLDGEILEWIQGQSAAPWGGQS